MSFRREQLASTMRREIGRLLAGGLADPRLEGVMISVVELEISPDGHQATVRVSILPHEAASKAMHALRHAAKHLRSQAGQRIHIRTMPRLEFVLDQTLKKEADVLAAIRHAVEEDEQHRRDQEHPEAESDATVIADPQESES